MSTPLIDDCRYCHFCGKTSKEVQKLIAGPTVFICDECVSLCVSIINSDDNTFFIKIKRQLIEDNQMKKPLLKTIDDAPEEFWNLMDQENIYERMAAALIRSDMDFSDHLAERAYNLMNKSRIAGSAAWKIIHEKYPETVDHQMSASCSLRKVSIWQ
jgi:hypothetical protein